MTTLHRFLLAAALAALTAAGIGGGRAVAGQIDPIIPQPELQSFSLDRGQVARLGVTNVGGELGRAELYLFDQTDDRVLASLAIDRLAAGETAVLELDGDRVAEGGDISRLLVLPAIRFYDGPDSRGYEGPDSRGYEGPDTRITLEVIDKATGQIKVIYAS